MRCRAVEALTIVLAAGTNRQWRSMLQGVTGALIVLTAVIATLGPALHLIPLPAPGIEPGQPTASPSQSH